MRQSRNLTQSLALIITILVLCRGDCVATGAHSHDIFILGIPTPTSTPTPHCPATALPLSQKGYLAHSTPILPDRRTVALSPAHHTSPHRRFN